MISVADLIVRHLRHAGVGFIFGVPGGGSNLDLIGAAGRHHGPSVIEARIDPGTYAETLHTIRG